MTNKNIVLITVVILVIFLVLSGNPFFVLDEGQQAVITQFGKPISTPIVDAGLHYKIPFIQKVNYFEKRILEWDGYPNQIPTKDKKYISVESTARWRINDPLLFLQSVYNETGAHARLDDIIDAAVRDIVTAHNLIEIVRTSNQLTIELRANQKNENEFIEEGALEEITVGRDILRTKIIERAREITPQYGIELIDVQITRVNYIEDVRRKVYERMIAERKKAAEEYRSQGRGIRAEIQGRTEKELKRIISEAYRKSQEIKGKADAFATKIFAQAYNQDPDFFSFLKTLSTYEKTIDENTTVILTTKGEYFKYLKESSPRQTIK